MTFKSPRKVLQANNTSSRSEKQELWEKIKTTRQYSWADNDFKGYLQIAMSPRSLYDAFHGLDHCIRSHF